MLIIGAIRALFKAGGRKTCCLQSPRRGTVRLADCELRRASCPLCEGCPAPVWPVRTSRRVVCRQRRITSGDVRRCAVVQVLQAASFFTGSVADLCVSKLLPAFRRNRIQLHSQPWRFNNSVRQDPYFWPTGIPGLDNILGGGLVKDRIYLIEGEPGTGKTTTGLQFLVEGVQARRVRRRTSPGGGGRRNWRGRSPMSTGGAGQASSSTRCCPREPADAGSGIHRLFHPSEVEMGAHHPDDPVGHREAQADAGGDRLPVRTAAAGRLPAALSPPGAGPQAVFRQPLLHGDAAGRPHRRRHRPPGAQHRPRRDHAGPVGEGLWRRAPGASAWSKYRGVAVRGGMPDYDIQYGGPVRVPRAWSPRSRG